eukprot:COSAG05_NODE_20560_length_278_cov_0.865922_1_plen_30_part_10
MDATSLQAWPHTSTDSEPIHWPCVPSIPLR